MSISNLPKRELSFLDINNIFDKFQSGFMKNHSTESAVGVLNGIFSSSDLILVTEPFQ